jgi:hypothetical protein
MPAVDLVYDTDCPNVPLARANLMHAFSGVGMTASWSEHRIGDPSAPEHVRGYGSPTILVDGRDVAGLGPGAETSCRLYEGAERAPSVEQIARALATSGRASTARTSGHGGWRSSLAVLPGVGFALLPKVACPACWPAYAGLLGSLGLGFLLSTEWLLPIIAAFLLLAVAALGFRARRRRGFGPLLVGLGASAVVLIGKFALESDPALYLGLAILVAASVWNTWPRRTARACSACATTLHEGEAT